MEHRYPAALGTGGLWRLTPALRLPGWLMIACATVLIAFAGVAARGADDNGLRLASQLAWRFTMIVYFLAIVAGPLGRLVPVIGRHGFYRERRQLMWGFLASFGVFLASVLIPNALPWPGRDGLTGGMLFFVMFGASLACVTAYAVDPRLANRIGEPQRRALMGVGLSYFWLVYVLSGLSHLSERQDFFYPASVALLALALLVRLLGRVMAK